VTGEILARMAEIAAVATGLSCVWLTGRQDIRCWPVGIASTALYAWIFLRTRLYGQAGLQVVFVVMQAWSWRHWATHGPGGSELPVRSVRPREAAGWGTVVLAGTAVMGWLSARYTDNALPGWDAFITVASLVAQWTMGRKVLESFALWMAVEVVSIGVYARSGLWPTTGLYAVFLILAASCFRQWRADERRSA
jgi:nicotinamide mononucleotide transporter